MNDACVVDLHPKQRNAFTMEMVIIYPVFIGIAVATAELARDKGYKGRWWFLLALLIPVFSAIVLLLMKKKEKVTPSTLIPEPHVTHRDKILYQKPV